MRFKFNRIVGKHGFSILIIAICAIFIISGIFYISSYKGYWWDEAVYLGLAKNIQNGQYQINIGDESNRAPFYPLIISLFSMGDASLRALSMIFGAASILVVYLFTKKLYDRKTAVISSLLLATSNMFLFYSQKILTESLFALIFTGALFSFYLGMEKDKKYLILTGVLTGLAFLTRYPGIILIPIFVIYMVTKVILSKNKIKEISRLITKELILGIIIFLLVLTPWIIMSQNIYHDPLGALKDQFSKMPVEYAPGPWYYYIRHSFEIFGFVMIFSIPALIYVILHRKKQNLFILISILAVLLLFSFVIARKELRYLISFSPLFYIFAAIGVTKFSKWFKKEKIVLGFVLLLCIFSLVSAIQSSYYDLDAGKAMVETGNFIKTLNDTNFVGENYPVLNYVSGKKIYQFPPTEKGFYDYVRILNISYYVIDVREPTTPAYVKNLNCTPTFKSNDKWNNVTVCRLF